MNAIEKIQLPTEFWRPTEIPPIPLLKDLNDWVIAHNERRLPKWKFKFAADLAVQIQPKVTRAHFILFECVALQTIDVTARLFTTPTFLRSHPHPYSQISFRLLGNEKDTNWLLKPTSCRRSSRLAELRQRLVEELRPEHFALTANSMLSPSCLCCGKSLTDPVSQARWVGPECWGSASTNLPRLFAATHAEGEAA
jgi:hypothetical protein